MDKTIIFFRQCTPSFDHTKQPATKRSTQTNLTFPKRLVFQLQPLANTKAVSKQTTFDTARNESLIVESIPVIFSRRKLKILLLTAQLRLGSRVKNIRLSRLFFDSRNTLASYVTFTDSLERKFRHRGIIRGTVTQQNKLHPFVNQKTYLQRL